MRVASEKMLNVLLIAVCVIVGANAAIQLLERIQVIARPLPAPSLPGPQRPTAGAPNIYQAGDTLPVVDDYSYAGSRGTLVMMVKSTCTFCTQSMPFYQRLADKAQSTKGQTRLLAVSTEPQNVVGSYLESHNVRIDNVRSVPESYMRIVGTPTLALVDSGGRVRNVWIGLQAKPQEEEVLRAMDSVQ